MIKLLTNAEVMTSIEIARIAMLKGSICVEHIDYTFLLTISTILVTI